MRRQLLAPTLGGAVLGLAVALLLQMAIRTTPQPLSPSQAFWQTLLLALAGGLSGLALSVVIALQASSSDPELRRRRRRSGPADAP
jgi:ABC-type lipoprotein release transport system permease subunit